MPKAAVVSQELGPDERAQLDFAFDLLALVFDATPLVLVLEDRRGVFLHFPSGHERELVALLRDTDWTPTLQLVQEHTDS